MCAGFFACTIVAFAAKFGWLNPGMGAWQQVISLKVQAALYQGSTSRNRCLMTACDVVGASLLIMQGLGTDKQKEGEAALSSS